jgi:hypothetical protein
VVDHHRDDPGPAARGVLLLVFIIATVLAETGYKTFLTSFENFIDVLLFFFVTRRAGAPPGTASP